MRASSLFVWGEIWDSNPRPSGPQPDALTNCANPTVCGRVGFRSGVPRGIRTLDLLLRRQLLYPAELWAQDICRPLASAGGRLDGAGDGNRTHAASLEGWNSTIEQHPRFSAPLSYHRLHQKSSVFFKKNTRRHPFFQFSARRAFPTKTGRRHIEMLIDRRQGQKYVSRACGFP